MYIIVTLGSYANAYVPDIQSILVILVHLTEICETSKRRYWVGAMSANRSTRLPLTPSVYDFDYI